MDFSQLTDKQLDEFLTLNNISLSSLTREEKIITSRDLFSRLQDTDSSTYTIPVADLYLASSIQFSSSQEKYDYAKLIHSSIRQLTPLFNYFGLEPSKPNKRRLINILGYAGLINYEIGNLDKLPREIISLILNKLSDSELKIICKTSSLLNTICAGDEFWHARYDTYIGRPVANTVPINSWKIIYFNMKYEQAISLLFTDAFGAPTSGFVLIHPHDKLKDLIQSLESTYGGRYWIISYSDQTNMSITKISNGVYTKTYNQETSYITDNDILYHFDFFHIAEIIQVIIRLT